MEARPHRVLIVDDDPAIREIMAAVLAREGLEVDVASDGEQAVAMLGRARYGAVLLDLLMPRLDGAGVIRHIREHNLDAPVIVISAITDPTDDLDPTIVRVAMQKPIALRDLRTVVHAVLRATDEGG